MLVKELQGGQRDPDRSGRRGVVSTESKRHRSASVEGLKATRWLKDGSFRRPTTLSLKELEAPSSPVGGDWLEDVNVPSSTDSVDDLDVGIVANSSQPDPAEVTQIFHRPEDDLFGPNGSEGMGEPGGRKPTLPGLPSTPSGKRGQQKSLPPPLPPPEGSRPSGRKH
jgi:hypothetical protein